MGTVPVPQHQHVRYISYPTDAKRVWYFLVQHSDLVTSSPQIHLYGKRLATGKMDFRSYGYKTLQEMYDTHFMKIQKANQQLADTVVAARARDSLIVALRDQWKGGLSNVWAQTRLASSYGLLQLTVGRAVDEGNYPENNSSYAPERLNETAVFFNCAVQVQDSSLRRVLGANYGRAGNWSRGFNDRMHELMHQWNPGRSGYADSIFQYSWSYFPTKH